jgi:hypothetical protein
MTATRKPRAQPERSVRLTAWPPGNKHRHPAGRGANRRDTGPAARRVSSESQPPDAGPRAGPPRGGTAGSDPGKEAKVNPLRARLFILLSQADAVQALAEVNTDVVLLEMCNQEVRCLERVIGRVREALQRQEVRGKES